MDVWVNLRFYTRFRPDLLYLLLCFLVFVSFTLLSIKKEDIFKYQVQIILSKITRFILFTKHPLNYSKNSNVFGHFFKLLKRGVITLSALLALRLH